MRKCLWHWVTGRDWKNFEVHDRKSLQCVEEKVVRNMDIKGSSDKGSDGSEEHSRESFYHLGEYLYCHEQNIGRNRNIKGASGEVSEGNEEHIIGN